MSLLFLSEKTVALINIFGQNSRCGDERPRDTFNRLLTAGGEFVSDARQNLTHTLTSAVTNQSTNIELKRCLREMNRGLSPSNDSDEVIITIDTQQREFISVLNTYVQEHSLSPSLAGLALMTRYLAAVAALLNGNLLPAECPLPNLPMLRTGLQLGVVDQNQRSRTRLINGLNF